MRNIRFASGEHYHVYNRGNGKQLIFLNDKDRTRFLLILLYFQSPLYFNNMHRLARNFVQHLELNIREENIQEIAKKRYVSIESFVLMPNHFHLIVLQEKDHGISRYMQRVLNAYTKYFNTKHEKSGHVFQGTFQAVYIQTNRQLLHTSAYIHRNPRELKQWHGRESQFLWSSYQDYVIKNRWGNLLKTEIINSQFSGEKDYKKFVETSGTKNLDDGDMFNT